MKLKFLGGAGMVTGSNYLLTSGDDQILVDCGLHQGDYYCEKHNFEPFEYDVKKVKAVLVTHAHIDHTGRLPKLYKDGFRGKVFSTPPTKDFAKELLTDSEDILGREAEREGRERLYTSKDVDGLMTLWQGANYDESFSEAGFKITFRNAGHILGSSSIIVERDGKTIVFSGDLGNVEPPLIKEWKPIDMPVDYCLIESAYGDRLHEDLSKRQALLEDAVEEAISSKGVLMIPAFAMERIQQLLFELNEFVENGRVPKVPVFLDSPLAIKITAVYKWYEDYFNDEALKLLANDKSLFSFPGLKLSFTSQESKTINEVLPPKIIIAGSGMSQGGRILFHETRYLSDPNSTILFIGYQTVGSLGRRIMDGAKTVKIFGQDVPVRCRIASIGGYSAHADQKQLLKWAYPMRHTLKKAFVVQGDAGASETLASKMRDEMAIDAVVPSIGDEVTL
jgi:metallo-beta-lactamase family protein